MTPPGTPRGVHSTDLKVGRSVPWKLPTALAIFFLSGIAALTYQVAWQRLLVIFSGADVHSATIVVAAFMVGLGFGSLLGGQVADRVSAVTGISLFALAELLVAIFGVFSPWLFYDVLYARLGTLSIGIGGVATILVFALFVPTFLMGASLPLLARGMTVDLRHAATTVGWLYGINSFGASVGALVTTFGLLPLFGMAGGIRIAAALNVVCAIAAISLALAGKRSHGDSVVAEATVQGSSTVPAVTAARLSLNAWFLVFALSGFVALSLEMLWFRTLGVMLKSTSLTFGTLLALYLAGVGIGAMAGSAVAKHVRQPALWFFVLQFGSGAYALLGLAGIVWRLGHVDALTWFRTYFAGYDAIDISDAVRSTMAIIGVGEAPHPRPSRVVLDFLRLYLFLPALLFGPPTFMAGFSFPLLQRAVQTNLAEVGRRVGGLLAANIVGSTLGAFITGWLLLDRLGTPGTLRLLFALSAVFGVLAVRAIQFNNRWASRFARIGLVLIVAAILASTPTTRRFWASLHGTTEENVIVAEDGSGLSVLKAEAPLFRRVVVFVNGLGQSHIPYGNIHTILGAFPAFAHPHPRRAAVIGLGSGDTLFGMTGRPELEHVASIEIIGPQLDTLREFSRFQTYPGVLAILNDPRIEHVVGDGRLYLRRATQKFDLVEADALRPTSAYSGNLYSDAYFRLLQEHLNPGGLAVTWAPTPRVRRTFMTVFPYVWQQEQLLMGSDTPIRVDPRAMRARLQANQVRDYFLAAGVDIEKLLEPYLSGPPRSDGQIPYIPAPGDINTDLHPRDELHVP